MDAISLTTLRPLLKKVKPAVIVAPHPQLDSHADHQFATVALAAALSRRRRRAILLLYTKHADRNRYPYGPAGTVVSLPPPVEQEVQIDRVYSHPVSTDLQRQQLFALESMHDLRSSPSRLYQVEVGADRSIEPEEAGPIRDKGRQLSPARAAFERALFRLRRNHVQSHDRRFSRGPALTRAATHLRPIAFSKALHGTGRSVHRRDASRCRASCAAPG